MHHVLGLSRPWKQTRNYSKQKKRLNNGGHGSLGGHFWDPNPTGRSQGELAMALVRSIIVFIAIVRPAMLHRLSILITR